MVKSDGTEMNDNDWKSGNVKSLGIILSSAGIDKIMDKNVLYDNLMLIFNPSDENIKFKLPENWENAEIIIDSVHDSFPINLNSGLIDMDTESAFIIRMK